MPHDKNGRRIHVGDIVHGPCYVTSHPVIGQVLAVNESTTCNITVAVARVINPLPGAVGAIWGGFGGVEVKLLQAVPDYGSAENFEVLVSSAPEDVAPSAVTDLVVLPDQSEESAA